MKNVLKVCIVVLLTINLSAQDLAMNTNTKAGVFEFETETIDYGTIEQNTNGNRIFTFRNVGSSPIIINKVKASCGCTVPTKPNQPIMPGKTGEISVKYATNRLGSFSKSITITSNASEAKKMIRVKGKVVKIAQ